MSLKSLVPEDWRRVLVNEFKEPYFKDLEAFIEAEYKTEQVFPPKDKIFNAMHLTPFKEVKVLILGQDPYHDDGQAHGLCFSVMPGIKIPPSLRNIYKELHSDLGISPAKNGCLTKWAEQGILLLNAVLSVRAHNAGSHSKKGWEKFTDAVIKVLNETHDPLVFVLWGNYAIKKRELIDESKHVVISSAHPSPLSASRGFFGTKPFSQINENLERLGKEAMSWQLEEPEEEISQLEFGF